MLDTRSPSFVSVFFVLQNSVILTTGTFHSTAKRNQKGVVQMAASLFDIPPDSFECFDGRSFRIVNRLLCD